MGCLKSQDVHGTLGASMCTTRVCLPIFADGFCEVRIAMRSALPRRLVAVSNDICTERQLSSLSMVLSQLVFLLCWIDIFAWWRGWGSQGFLRSLPRAPTHPETPYRGMLRSGVASRSTLEHRQTNSQTRFRLWHQSRRAPVQGCV